ncbi:uncharacterized protein N7458_000985 [Penicillium daleae]|uniref:Rhodopsin domain-containing protein n=1 Tax=Penicillium daleae TaxID=63821 RepID=A0AAD6G8T3_9EURO|nr:uncharacterized protein N7458_000985 [Penicillium daleae]KAJ5465299.1 hypothetical protein N7458_000985 [Penicillium daleae]
MQLSSSSVLLDARDASIDRSVQTWNYACQSLCIIGMTLFFGLRVYTRCFILSGFGKEDWLCSAAWFLGVCYSIIALIMGHYGGGLHYSDVAPKDRISFNKPLPQSRPRHYGFMALMLAYYIPAVIVKVRICNPISLFWDVNVEGTCLDETSIILADAVVSCVSDLIILLLPLPLTMTLQISKKKKMRVIAILGAGGLAVAASIIRLVLIVLTGQSKDATLAFMRINMLGNAEIAIGVICTCLPALSALLKRVFHEYSSNKHTRESEYKLSSMRNQTKTERSKNQMTVQEAESDEDMLVSNAQSNPTETTIYGDAEERGFAHTSTAGGLGITRTVNVSTSVEQRLQ